MSYSKIVVGTDGSATAQLAVERAAELAKAAGVPLIVATSWYRDMPDGPVPSELAEWPGDSAGAMEADWASKTVSDGAGIARAAGVENVQCETPEGGPADGLIELVAGDPDALLVVGTVGLGSRAERVIGNVPHQITHHAPVDVLLVRTVNGELSPYRRVALATDGSKTATRAVERGLGLVDAVGADALLVTVARDPATGERVLDQAEDRIGNGHLDRRVQVGGDVDDALAQLADDVDLLVIGNKGMSGPSRLLGSVANAITHRVPTDLLLVNTTKRA